MADENKVGPMICKNDGECENKDEKGYCVNLEKPGASEGFCCLCESMMNPDQDPRTTRIIFDCSWTQKAYIFVISLFFIA